ncbi:MAG: O-antigen ligase family protein [Hyphomicrobium sp.]
MLTQTVNAIDALRTSLQQRSTVHTLALVLVWVAMALSGLVFSEPCPTDALAAGLIILLPTIGLVQAPPLLALFLMVWGTAATFGLFAATASGDIDASVKHTMVSLFLAGYGFTIAGFVAARPLAHMRLILNGLTVAATIACAAGIIGYFGLLPGSEIFTKFGRASGTFKDPNVFGPFLVPALLYCLHIALGRPLKASLLPLTLAGFLALGVFLSFSRGAWMNLIVALGLYLALAFVTAPSNARRQKIALLGALGASLIAGIVGGALQDDRVAALVNERASMAQSYDVGPEGRFGGQEKAIGLILEHPLGIGAGEFARVYHHEEPHNVYLSMPLNAGWVGAGLYVVAVLMTLIIGAKASFRRTDYQPLVIIAFAAFVANAAEGLIIDTDHWRHFYVLMAMVWGMAAAPMTAAAKSSSRERVSAQPRSSRIVGRAPIRATSGTVRLASARRRAAHP